MLLSLADLTSLPVPQWVIADTHFGHANIMIYCPWRQTWAKDIVEHDEMLINAWNQMVKPDDWVLHLGDFSLKKLEPVTAYRRSLNGKICLIRGNHDRSHSSMLEAGFDLVASIGDICIDDERWLCCHNPEQVDIKMLAGVQRLLHGHFHGQSPITEPIYPPELAIDCGIDALQSIAPVPWDQVR